MELGVLASVFYLPALACLWDVVRPLRSENSVIAGAALAWMAAFLVAGYKKTDFECPRCHELFFRKFDDRPWRMGWQYNPFARHCMHCGLPKWQEATD